MDFPDLFASRVTLRHLRLVAAIVKAGNIQAAAAELNVTQPTATKQLQDLELILGVKLFERTNRGMIPTAYGEIADNHARLVLAQMRTAGEAVQDLIDGAGGRVVVGSLLAGSARLLPDALIQLKTERPRVSVVVQEGANDVLMPALRSGDIDLVVGRLPEFRDREGLVQAALYDEIACLVVRASHPMAGLRSISLADLGTQDWIFPRPVTTLRRQVEKAFFDADVDLPAHPIEAISAAMNLRITLQADVVSIWPYQAIRDELSSGRLTALPVFLQTTLGPVGYSVRRGPEALSPAASYLVEQLHRVGEEIQTEGPGWRELFNQ